MTSWRSAAMGWRRLWVVIGCADVVFTGDGGKNECQVHR